MHVWYIQSEENAFDKAEELIYGHTFITTRILWKGFLGRKPPALIYNPPWVETSSPDCQCVKFLTSSSRFSRTAGLCCPDPKPGLNYESGLDRMANVKSKQVLMILKKCDIQWVASGGRTSVKNEKNKCSQPVYEDKMCHAVLNQQRYT